MFYNVLLCSELGSRSAVIVEGGVNLFGHGIMPPCAEHLIYSSAHLNSSQAKNVIVELVSRNHGDNALHFLELSAQILSFIYLKVSQIELKPCFTCTFNI